MCRAPPRIEHIRHLPTNPTPGTKRPRTGASPGRGRGRTDGPVRASPAGGHRPRSPRSPDPRAYGPVTPLAPPPFGPRARTDLAARQTIATATPAPRAEHRRAPGRDRTVSTTAPPEGPHGRPSAAGRPVDRRPRSSTATSPRSRNVKEFLPTPAGNTRFHGRHAHVRYRPPRRPDVTHAAHIGRAPRPDARRTPARAAADTRNGARGRVSSLAPSSAGSAPRNTGADTRRSGVRGLT